MGKLGATFLPGLVGDVDIPALGAATFGWLTEDADAADSTPASRSVALSPRTIGGAVPMSRRFVKQSSPAAEMVVERLLRRGAAAAIDQGIIQGSGAAGQPRGIVNAVGVNTEVIAVAGQPSWADIVNFETAVATDEALAGKLAYLMAHGVKGHCKVTTKDAGSGRFIWEADSVNGYTAIASNLVPANGIIFGNFEDVYVGLWGTLDINPDAATKAASGGLVLRVFQDVDCGFGNAVSFCVNA
jgi:HK97 family phage major capsid protein